MFDKFGDYMFYLLNAPLKKMKNGKNQLKIFFSVVGEVFDELLHDILKFRRQKMISTAEPLILEVIGQDRDMFRLQGESIEKFRHRLQMKAIIAELGGTNTGLLMAIEVLGYPECTVEPLYKTDKLRWAEIYIDILVLRDINYDAILYETLKVKTARTLPIFRFIYRPERTNIKSIAIGGVGCCIKVKARVATTIDTKAVNNTISALIASQNILVKADNELKESDVYVVLKDSGEKIRVLTENGSIVRTG